MPHARLALATHRFEESCRFYGELLGCAVLDGWDRPGARARVFDLFGVRLEVLDAERESGMRPGAPGDLVHLVVECEDLAAMRGRLRVDAPEPVATSWGARLFALRDPDGIAVTFLQRT